VPYVAIAAETLDDVVGNRHPTVMKIDVEGFEGQVVQGGRNTFASQSLLAVIMELNGSGSRYGFDEERLRLLMSDWGFRSYHYDPFGRTLAPAERTDGSPNNTLFVRDVTRLAERVRSAPRHTVNGSCL
jgi:hypothetical protein